MSASGLEFLVEDLSMESFLNELLPRILPQCEFRIHSFQGKQDLLKKLENRLRGYVHWLSDDWRLIVLVDRDNENCRELKKQLESAAHAVNLRTHSQFNRRPWQLANLIAIEELEAWYFGDWNAVRSVFPKVSPNIPSKAKYRNPDAIQGGTWEAFERILKDKGYFETGIRKVEVAKGIGGCISPVENNSHSFQKFFKTLIEATS